MSRGVEGRDVAWQVWRKLHGVEVDGELVLPTAFIHWCGSAGDLDTTADYSEVMCPGCRFELSRPEDECTPLYSLPSMGQKKVTG